MRRSAAIVWLTEHGVPSTFPGRIRIYVFDECRIVEDVSIISYVVLEYSLWDRATDRRSDDRVLGVLTRTAADNGPTIYILRPLQLYISATSFFTH